MKKVLEVCAVTIGGSLSSSSSQPVAYSRVVRHSAGHQSPRHAQGDDSEGEDESAFKRRRIERGPFLFWFVAVLLFVVAWSTQQYALRELTKSTRRLEAQVLELEARLAAKVTNEDLEADITASSQALRDAEKDSQELSNKTIVEAKGIASEGVDRAASAARDAIREGAAEALKTVNETATIATAEIQEIGTRIEVTSADAVKKVVQASVEADRRVSNSVNEAERRMNETEARLIEALERRASQLTAEVGEIGGKVSAEVTTVAKQANETARSAASAATTASEALGRQVESATTSTSKNLLELNRTAEAATKRVEARADESEKRMDAKSNELLQSANRVEERLDASATQLIELENLVNVYEATTDSRFDSQNALLRAWIAGFFTLTATIFTIRHVYSHTTRMAFPEAQRKVLAILWMVPIYAGASWAAIVWPNAQDELQLASSCYEAYTVYMFFALLVAVLSDGKGEEAAVAQLPPDLEPPLQLVSCFRRCKGGRRQCCGVGGRQQYVSANSFMQRCKLYTLQFVVVKPLLSFLEYVLLRSFPVFRKGQLLDYTKPSLWITLLLNASVTLALAALFAFFHATQHSPRVSLHNPWPKFLAVKSVVFLTWFQSVAISVALRLQLGRLADESLAAAFQNFLVCIEMFVASAAHGHVFGADEWQPNFKPRHITASISDNLALHDFVRDVRSVLPSRRRRVKDDSSDLSPPPHSPPKEQRVELSLKGEDRSDAATTALLTIKEVGSSETGTIMGKYPGDENAETKRSSSVAEEESSTSGNGSAAAAAWLHCRSPRATSASTNDLVPLTDFDRDREQQGHDDPPASLV